MLKRAALLTLAPFFFSAAADAQGPCSVQSSLLACVFPQEYGSNPNRAFTQVLYSYPTPDSYQDGRPFHFINQSGLTLKPLTANISRHANLLPLASPSSGLILVYDPTLKTLVTSTDSLGPILGERAETVGRHRMFIGFSYQFFNFDKIDSLNLNSFPAILAHTDDNRDNSPPKRASQLNCLTNNAVEGSVNLGGGGFVRDRIDTMNTISLKVNQCTTYVTYGLTKRIDLSVLIPIETVNFSLYSQDTVVPGTSGFITPNAGSPNSIAYNQNGLTNGAPYFFCLDRVNSRG